MKIRISFILLMIGLQACLDQVEPVVEYEAVNRTIGPEGGTVSFYEDHFPGETSYDSKNPIPVVSLEIPPGALDSAVTFSIRKRYLLQNTNPIETWELTPANLRFNAPVKLTMTFGLSLEEYSTLNDRCFYKAYQIPLNGQLVDALEDVSLWQEVPEYQLNDDLTFTTSVASLDYIYLFNKGLDDPDYIFCDTSSDFTEIGLGGDYNLLVLPPGSMSSGSYLNLNYIKLPDVEDYPQPTLGDYVILSSSGSYLDPQANLTQLEDSAMLYYHANAEQAIDVWLDWQLAGDMVKFLKINPQTYEVLAVLDYDQELTDVSQRLYGLKFKEMAAYVLAVHKNDFKLRFGGRIDVSISGGTTYDKVIENYDYGGAFIDLFWARYDLNINPGKDETAGYFYVYVGPVGDDFTTREFPFSSQDDFKFVFYDNMDTQHWIKLKSFGGQLSYSLIDQEGGWLEGQLVTKDAQSAYNENGDDVEFTITFRFRVAKWFEL